jgi:hypothetical protein
MNTVKIHDHRQVIRIEDSSQKHPVIASLIVSLPILISKYGLSNKYSRHFELRLPSFQAFTSISIMEVVP